MLARRILLIAFAVVGAQAGNTTCKTNSLDWFTQSVGETPCRVYERLRQSCSPNYQVGNMSSAPPGDTCNDQLSACCCNSVAFALSMLCMNCQYGVGTSIGGDNGFDAPPGTYGKYLGSCGPVINQSLPNATQTAVCNQNIKVPSYLYTLFWGSGSTGNWFYEFTKETAQLEIQSGQNTTKFCNTVKPDDPNSGSGSGSNIGAIVGGVVGGVSLLVVAVLVWFFSRRRKNRRGVVDLGDGQTSSDMMFEPFSVPPMAPEQPTIPTSQYGQSSSSGTHPNSSSDAVSSSNYVPARPHKSGMIASSPPNRDETGGSRALLSPGGTQHSNERHEDSDALTSAFGLGRSASGRLPPSYEQR